jgi:hypothetical protein
MSQTATSMCDWYLSPATHVLQGLQGWVAFMKSS